MRKYLYAYSKNKEYLKTLFKINENQIKINKLDNLLKNLRKV